MTKENLLHFVCAKCDTHLSVEMTDSGVKAPCPSCGESITAPAKPKLTPVSSAASLEKVKKGVDSKPVKPEAKSSISKETQKVKTAAITESGEPINPRSGLTKTEEEIFEFGAIVKLLLLGLLALIVIGGLIYQFPDEIYNWLEATF